MLGPISINEPETFAIQMMVSLTVRDLIGRVRKGGGYGRRAPAMTKTIRQQLCAQVVAFPP